VRYLEYTQCLGVVKVHRQNREIVSASMTRAKLSRQVFQAPEIDQRPLRHNSYPQGVCVLFHSTIRIFGVWPQGNIFEEQRSLPPTRTNPLIKYTQHTHKFHLGSDFWRLRFATSTTQSTAIVHPPHLAITLPSFPSLNPLHQ